MRVDEAERDRFGALAEQWWDPRGPMRPLHQLAPARLAFIRDAVMLHCGRFAGLRLVDVGCGGGLVAEPCARLGATVTGLDPSPEMIAVATRHAAGAGLAIDYRVGEASSLAGAAFDALLALEVVEHTPSPRAFIADCAAALRPGGLLVLSTINRTLRSLALAKIGAEYVLRWLPRGTHDWQRFVTPGELADDCRACGLTPGEPVGVVYHPLADEWRLSRDTAVNYMTTAVK